MKKILQENRDFPGWQQIFVVMLLALFNPCNLFAEPIPIADDEHPGLIITTENLDEFKGKAKGENQFLYKQAKQLADEFSRRPLIKFKDAHNSYREIGDAMPVLGLMYQLTGDKKYVETARKWILVMLETESWEGSQNLGRSSWVVGLCFLYDWMFDALDENLKEKLVTRLVQETKIIIETASDTRALSNHLLIETSAVGMTGLVLNRNHNAKNSFLDQADNWANYIIDHAPTDGSWGEGIQYWQYGTGYFLRFLEAAQTAGLKNYFADYDWLKKTGYFPIYFSLPGNFTKVINFSDCGTDRYLPAFLLYLPAQKYRNGYFQDFGDKIQSKTPHKFSWLDFLFYDASVPAKDFTTLPLFHHFKDQGFVSMRSGWEKGATVVGFRCGPAPGHKNQVDPDRIEHKGFGPGHQQPDINSFVIFAQNEWLAIDPGYTHKKETQNHNTILVNGHGQAGAGGKWLDYMEFESRNPAPEIIYTESNPNYDYVIGDAGNIYVDAAGVKHFRRHLIFLKPNIVVVLDDIATRENSKIEWLLQLNENAKVEQVNNKFKINKNDAEYWAIPMLPVHSKASVTERLVEGNDVNGTPGNDEGMLKTIHLTKNAAATQFLVVLAVSENQDKNKPVAHLQDNKLTIVNNGKKWVLNVAAETSDSDQPILKIQDLQ